MITFGFLISAFAPKALQKFFGNEWVGTLSSVSGSGRQIPRRLRGNRMEGFVEDLDRSQTTLLPRLCVTGPTRTTPCAC
jgi:hypothetical protein